MSCRSHFASLLSLFVCVAAAGAEPPPTRLNVNDVSFLWRVPQTVAEVDALLSADGPLADGRPLWPTEAFDQVAALAQTVEVADSAGRVQKLVFDARFRADFLDLRTWKVVGIRIDPSAPGTHRDVVAALGSTPQLRCVLQPVTVRDGRLRVHDVAAHLVFDFTVGTARPAQPDRPAFQALCDDLRSLKADLTRAGISTDGELDVHPGFAAANFDLTERLRGLLRRHVRGEQVHTVAFMGIRAPEPWFFFATAKTPQGFKMIAPGPIAPAQAQMLAVGGTPVMPIPKNRQFSDEGVATAQLFGPQQSEAAALASESGSAAPAVKIREIADVIADPRRSHVINTDCVSCHTESTRRSGLRLANARDDLRFPLPAGISAVAASRLPRDSWNVRNFGWFPKAGAAVAIETVTQRTANESAESADFINREYPPVAAAPSSPPTPAPPASSPAAVDVVPPVSNALTLVMQAKSVEEGRKLRAVIEAMQRLPADQNPIVQALESIGTVHDARFVFLGEDRLAVITTYDDDFDSYLDAFVREIGPIFDRLLVHMADAPPLPVRDHPDEFADYVRKHDLSCLPPFYSAYPRLRVKDILTLERKTQP